MEKNSFVFYNDWYDAIRILKDPERLKVYEAISAFAFDGKEPNNLSAEAAMAMRFILPQLKRDVEKYNKICERNQRNGAKGGRPKKAKPYQNPNNPVGNLETQKNPNNPVVTYDNDNDYDNDNVNENVNVYKKKESLSASRTHTTSKRNSHDEALSECDPKLKTWMEENCKELLEAKNFNHYVSSPELQRLKDDYGWKKIADTILDLANRRDLFKKYSNMYRTIRNWIKRE